MEIRTRYLGPVVYLDVQGRLVATDEDNPYRSRYLLRRWRTMTAAKRRDGTWSLTTVMSAIIVVTPASRNMAAGSEPIDDCVGRRVSHVPRRR